jgi:NAD(P)-dependent dehydrogenase (short-subunit alcohol dehydrogenase family)
MNMKYMYICIYGINILYEKCIFRVFNINVRSVYQLTTLAVPYLIKTKGNIVNVSSVNGMRSFPGCLAYCMSKGALDQLTRCVALELAEKQVRTKEICLQHN